MLGLYDYKNFREIYCGQSSCIYHALRRADDRPVIIKTGTHTGVSDKEIAKLRREFEIASKIKSPYIIEYLDVVPCDTGVALILSDDGYSDLSKIIPSEGFSVQNFLDIAIAIVKGLVELHRCNITHNDIKTANIIVSTDAKITKIIDFGSASQLKQESKEPISLKRPAGTLAYISPEQTGRINRTVDYRTDLYSLGVTLYQLLCGKLPFEAHDPSQLLYDHIAKEPVAPYVLKRGEVPLVLSNIIMKLLMKNAESRYQSSYTLLKDLQYCQSQFFARDKIEDFTIAQNDFNDKLSVPEKLYGREAEVEVMLDAFKRVSEGKPEVLMVTGEPGIGKSFLVHEIQKPLTLRKGYFITGKFDQLYRNIAYSAIIVALHHLLSQILSEGEDSLKIWREKLLKSLGYNARVMIDLIPELELILGKMPALEHLDPALEKNRFNLVFQNFIAVFAQTDHPLVLFLDDLQWADLASLQLIENLMNNREIKSLFLIGAYRDTEVDETHPTLMTVHELQKLPIKMQIMTLPPLALTTVSRLIADALFRPIDDISALARLIHQKTLGNPFFIRLFLQSLYRSNSIRLSVESGWQWDLEAISRHPATDNVIQLMTHQLYLLPEENVNLLKIASCIGSQFTLVDLHIITKMPADRLLSGLQSALDMGIIFSKGLHFQFVHDRVQEAAYALLELAEKKSIHLQVGRAFLAVPGGRVHGKLFDIVDHFNQVLDLIEDPVERHKIAQLNLRAGIKAKKAAAYHSALIYLNAAATLWPIMEGWDKDYDFTFNVAKELAENQFLAGNHDSSKQIITATMPHLRTRINQAEFYNFLIVQETVKGNYDKAAEIASTALALFGLNISLTPSAEIIDAEQAQVNELLREQAIDTLLDKPMMTDPDKMAAFKLLTNLTVVGYFLGQDLLMLIILMMVRLSLQYGNVIGSCMAYACYGLLLCARTDKYELGYAFALLALRLSDKYNSLVQKCRVYDVIAHCIHHWSKPLSEFIPLVDEGYRAGLTSGEFQYASYVCSYKAHAFFNQGLPLMQVSKDLVSLMNIGKEMRNRTNIAWVTSVRLMVENLKGNTKDRLDFHLDDLTEEQYITDCEATREFSALCLHYILKAQVLYLYHQYEKALACIEKAKPLMSHITGQYGIATHNWYHSLILIALYPDATAEIQTIYWEQLINNQRKMKIWADHCPANFLHKYDLVAAEMAKIKREYEAISLYEKAVKGAYEHHFLPEHALSCELAAKYWLLQDNHSCARTYINDAYQSYWKWGAHWKHAEIKEKYRGRLAPLGSLSEFPINALTTISVDNLRLLDLTYLLRASHEISQEINLDKLLNIIMQTAVHTVGAQTGAFLLIDKKDNLMVQAEYLSSSNVSISENIDFSAWHHGSPAIINYVRRTGNQVILGNAVESRQFMTDGYLTANQTKSVLCVPVIKQGKTIGILYFENNLTKHAFLPYHADNLFVLASQIAISIENAMYFAEQIDMAEKFAKEKARADEARIQKVEQERFTSILSHEIRNPLYAFTAHIHAIRDGLNELLKTCPEPSRLANELNNIINSVSSADRCANHILTVLNDALTTAKIIAGKLQLRNKPCNLKTICKEVIEMHCALVNQSRVLLKLIVPEEDILVKADATNLKLSLINILTNSIKFTREGSITLQLKVQTIHDDKVTVQFRVIDTGVGMDEEEISRLFQRFYQTETGASDGYVGTGLGLYISKNLIELMGGVIDVKSVKGHGSCFCFELSFARLTEEEKLTFTREANSITAPIILDKTNKPKNILCVEDDASIRLILERQISKRGHRVKLAVNGEEALRKIFTEEFDLVLMDMVMPGLNGDEVTMRIRQMEESMGKLPVPIFFLSGNPPEEMIRITFSKGANGFLSKPISASELIRAIEFPEDIQESMLKLATVSEESLTNWKQMIQPANRTAASSAVDTVEGRAAGVGVLRRETPIVERDAVVTTTLGSAMPTASAKVASKAPVVAPSACGCFSWLNKCLRSRRVAAAQGYLADPR